MIFHYPALYQSDFMNSHTRDKIRIFLSQYKEFKKSVLSENTMDFAWNDGIGIFYHIDNMVREIELYTPNAKFIIENIDIFSVNVGNLKSILTSIKKPYQIIENQSIKIDDGKIDFYIPDYDELGDLARVETILIRVQNE